MASILGGGYGTRAGRPWRPASLVCPWLPGVGRLDLEVPALEDAGGVGIVVVLDEQRPGRIRRLLVTQPVQQAEALHRREQPGERSLQAGRVDACRRVAVEDREDPGAARRAGPVVVAVPPDVVGEV